MKSYQESFQEENEYLTKTICIIENEIQKESGNLSERKKSLLEARRDMWENAAHHSTELAGMVEINQHLTEITNQTAKYDNTIKRIQRLEKLSDSPYFGRFDFLEEGSNLVEQIYIGIYNLIESKTNNIYVYDWRAPISSMFYRFEPGKASYKAPCGEISGVVGLKRQYKILDSKLKYFFDCSMRINDEVLQEVLGRNTSTKMKNIVETIQKEQDEIIRDVESELLIVQGVAGSGKTSIALHRIAFLLYEGIDSKLDSNNIIIISPNVIFSKYISSVLPELGEDNVEQITMDEILKKYLEDRFVIETRNKQLETIIGCNDRQRSDFLRQTIEFKGSRTFITILDRWLKYYENNLLEFEDVYYHGVLIQNRQQLKDSFLDNELSIPMVKRLKRLENIILSKINSMLENQLKGFERKAEENEQHEFETKSFSPLPSIHESKAFIDNLHKFTEIDYFNIYKRLFDEQNLFHGLTYDLEIPKNIELIILETTTNLKKDKLLYEDALPMLYLKMKIVGENLYPDARQVVIDEAQDYSSMHYEVFRLMFNNARYTVTGDVSQAIEKHAKISMYDEIIKIFNKNNTLKLILNKSYRASYEINSFAQKFLTKKQDFISFERHETRPVIACEKTQEMLEQRIITDIRSYLDQGFETIAVICKTQLQARELYSKISYFSGIILVNTQIDEIEKGVMIVPVYMGKGLEFDAVLVYGVDENNYNSEYDKKLLYIACTRALHRLSIYYTGKKSRLLQ